MYRRSYSRLNRLPLLAVASIFFILLPNAASAQREAIVTCDTTYYLPSTMTPAEARMVAVERARIQPLADAFGTNVSQHISTVISNEDQRSSTSFYFIGESDVRDVWVRDLAQPAVEQQILDEMLVTRVRVKGMGRERKSHEATFDVRLYSRPEDNRRPIAEVASEKDFYQRNGQPSDLFIKFRSPVAGYILAYLIDENGDAFLLVPDLEEPGGACRVQADKEYTFLTGRDNGDGCRPTAEMVLGTSKKREINQIYVLFSPERLTKAPTEPGREIVLGNMTGTTPPYTPHKAFQKYVSRCYGDKEFQIQKIRFGINRLENGD